MKEGEFTPTAKNRSVNFANCDIDPPSAAYIDVDDQLYLLCEGSSVPLVVQANLRILRPHGGIESVQITLSVPTAFVLASTTRPEVEGYILSAEVVIVTGGGPGVVVYAMLGVRRTGLGIANEFNQLVADYLTPFIGASWPARPTKRAAEGPGNLLSASLANPAAGADWTYTIPANQRVQVMYFSAQLVTSATAATRTVSLKITDGTNTLFLVDSPNTQIASLTEQYNGYSGAFAGGTGLTHLYLPLPSPLLLGSGYTIGTVTNNIQAGDQWSGIHLSTVWWVDAI